MYDKLFLCLANSWKPPSGRCLAGREIVNGRIGAWVRPVSERPTHEVSEEDRLYKTGGRAALLDRIRVQFLRPEPFDHQIENHVFDGTHYFVLEGRATWLEVQACLDRYDANFWSSDQSTQHGCADKISAPLVQRLGSSLKLIQVARLTVCVAVEHNDWDHSDKLKVRGEFEYQGREYKLSLTDPELRTEYMARGDGKYVIENPALCISIVEVWNGFAFRVIASAITPARCG